MLSEEIKAIFKNVNTPKFCGLVLTDDREVVSQEIWKLYKGHDGFLYDPSLQCFRFFGTGLLWVHSIPKVIKEGGVIPTAWNRYLGMRFQNIVIEGVCLLDLIKFLDKRLIALGTIEPTLFVNGEPGAKVLKISPAIAAGPQGIHGEPTFTPDGKEIKQTPPTSKKEALSAQAN